MRPKILLVDDEPFNLDYLAQEIEDQEVEVATAANGQEALAAVAADPPDMVFLDIMMPGMDGFAVLQRLKADPASNGIPVVIISAASDLRSVVRGIELGAEDFLPKPFDPVLLHARLKAGLEKKRLRDLEQRYLRSLERELEIGRQIQAGFLPQSIRQPPGWEVAAFFQPAREVAGDFYDVFDLEEGKMAVLIGDVTDKGVGSALYMALFRSLLRATVQMELLAGEDVGSDALRECRTLALGLTVEERLKRAVTVVNNYIALTHRSPLFATLFYGVIDLESGALGYVNGGHDHPYLLRGGTVHAALAPTGLLVGAIAGANYLAQTVALAPGDTLVLYSDGIIDAENPAGDRVGREPWREMLAVPVESAPALVTRLTDQILGFIGDAPQYDDITLLVVRRLPKT
jgi:serine phosphatase RsbU (regulator of sigma subunit)